ncbi:uncharacterized protein LOC108732852 [Agrilus planipennis]|nr:uncharacterized protein LOC108732852 [Agrilus planipennis]
MAAISLGFIVLVTPWTIQEVVVACTGTRAPPTLDFLVTWLSMSHTFWNPFLYWLLNNQFRRICRELFFTRIFCRTMSKKKSIQHSCCNNSPVIIRHKEGCDFQGLSEKYWGEILDRTLSSNSLQNLHRSFSHPHVNCYTPTAHDLCILDLGVPAL